jgi:uncharacterized membrane protein
LSGALAGFAVGALWAIVQSHRARIDALDARVLELTARPSPEAPRPAPAPSAPSPATPPPIPPPTPKGSEPPHARAALREFGARPVETPGPASGPSLLPFFTSVVEFFTTGNLVAKLGVVILFFGVAFLLRFAAERGLLPIEYRLIGVALAAIVMLGVGWRLRHTRGDYARAVQGGAVGILYLTIFAAYRLYVLVGALPALGLMLTIVVLSGALAVLQSSQALAVLGTAGGFLAPILASTGSGNHVSLFSYYLVLNIGVVGLAWFRAWRVLNWLGFVFTFGIGLMWGSQFYRPTLFATTEPFLVTFFLFYVAVVVLFALRQPPTLRGYIDGSLTFGLPGVAFAMQSRLMADVPFGRAYSAVAVSALYLALARGLWRRTPDRRALAEAFLALSVVFLTLSIPLAFDGYVAAAGWALEGAALVWIGFRQARVLARTAGVLLLVGAGLAFAVLADSEAGNLAVLNSRFVGGAAIALGSLIAAYQYFRHTSALRQWETFFERTTLGWGLLWWTGTLYAEVDRFTTGSGLGTTLAMGLAASAVVLAAIARRQRWPALAYACLPLLPLVWLIAAATYLAGGHVGPWANRGWIGWPVAGGGSVALLWLVETMWPPAIARAWHAGTTWLVTFLLTWAAAVGVAMLVSESATWSHVMWAVVPSVVAFILVAYGDRLPWPVNQHAEFYATVVPALPVCGAVLWTLWAVTSDGDPSPLPYVPIVNPLELTQAGGLAAAFFWIKRATRSGSAAQPLAEVGRPLGVSLGFLCMNAVVGRIVHVFGGVPFDWDSLTSSAAFQAGLSVLWGVTALSVMTLATRRAQRQQWIIGAGLLGSLVVKLFLVDLRNVNGIFRIASFLVTGLLILAIGYLSPAPPRREHAP